MSQEESKGQPASNKKDTKKVIFTWLKITAFIIVSAVSLRFIFLSNELSPLLQLGLFFLWMFLLFVLYITYAEIKDRVTTKNKSKNKKGGWKTIVVGLGLILIFFLVVFLLVFPLALAYSHSVYYAPAASLLLLLFASLSTKHLFKKSRSVSETFWPEDKEEFSEDDRALNELEAASTRAEQEMKSTGKRENVVNDNKALLALAILLMSASLLYLVLTVIFTIVALAYLFT